MTLAYIYPPMKKWITNEGTTVEHPYIVHTKLPSNRASLNTFPDLEPLESLRVPRFALLGLVCTVACETNGADGPE
jgi:hypothetical protein